MNACWWMNVAQKKYFLLKRDISHPLNILRDQIINKFTMINRQVK